MKAIRHIIQRHTSGCGIACLAMLANLSYRQALKLTNPDRWFWQKVYPPNTHELRQHLIDLHIGVGKWHWEGVILSTLDIPCLIIIRYSDTTTHAVVWDPSTQTVLDPDRSIGACNHDYYQKLSIGYLPIFPNRENQ